MKMPLHCLSPFLVFFQSPAALNPTSTPTALFVVLFLLQNGWLYHLWCFILLKGELRSQLHPCFYVRFLLIVWRKSTVQGFMVFWSDLTSYKFTKFCSQPKWHHARKCIKHVMPCFLCILCYFYGEKTSLK